MIYVRGMSERRKMMAAVAAIALLAFAFRVVDIDRPHETWDEITTYAIGLNQWYNIIRMDFSQESWYTYDQIRSIHPPFARYVYGAVNGAYLLSQTGTGMLRMNYTEAVQTMYALKSLIPGRLLSALLAAGAAVLIFLLARRYFGNNAAILSSILFALLPVTMAQTRLAALDALLLFMFTLAVYLFARGLEDKKYFYASLLATGLAVSTKFNAMTLFFLLPALFFLHGGRKAIGKRHLLLIPLVSAAVLYVLWPRLWLDPIGGIATNIGWWESLGNVNEYFLGGFEHPFHYMATYVIVTTPALMLLMLAFGFARSARERAFGHRMALAWILIPLFIYSFYHFRQAGPRYVIMVYPALAILAALGIEWLSLRIGRAFRLGRMRTLAHAIVPVVVIAYLVSVAASVHPYYLDYYNEIVGGPGNVYEKHMFAIGQWGEGIDEAAYWLNANARGNSSVQLFVMPRHVIPRLRSDMMDLTPFIPKYVSGTDNINWDLTNTTAEADYVVENVFFRLYMNESFHGLIAGEYALIKTVDVQGAPLAWVYERRAIHERQSRS